MYSVKQSIFYEERALCFTSEQLFALVFSHRWPPAILTVFQNVDRSNKSYAKPLSPGFNNTHGCVTFFNVPHTPSWMLVYREAYYKQQTLMWGKRGRGTAWSPNLCLHSPALTSAASWGLGRSTVAIREGPVYLPGKITVALCYIFSKQEMGRMETQKQG